MCFSELLWPLCVGPHRLLCVDSPLTETQRAIHPLSEQNVTFVALQTFQKPQTCQRKPIMIRVSSCMFTGNYLKLVGYLNV